MFNSFTQMGDLKIGSSSWLGSFDTLPEQVHSHISFEKLKQNTILKFNKNDDRANPYL